MNLGNIFDEDNQKYNNRELGLNEMGIMEVSSIGNLVNPCENQIIFSINLSPFIGLNKMKGDLMEV